MFSSVCLDTDYTLLKYGSASHRSCFRFGQGIWCRKQGHGDTEMITQTSVQEKKYLQLLPATNSA